MSRDYPVGTYTFLASKPGYQDKVINVRVVGYDITNADASLTYVGIVGPSSTTLSAIDITSNSVTLRGEVNPNGLSTNVDFASGDISSSLSYFSNTPVQNIGSGNSPVIVTAVLTNLLPNTVYKYAVRAINSQGNDNGNVISFTTLSEVSNGILKIRSNVNAKAYVDNTFVGDTIPTDYLTYITTAGTHTVSVSQTGYISYSSSIIVKSDKMANPFTYVDVNLISNNPTLPQVTVPVIPTPNLPGGGWGGWNFNFPDWNDIFGDWKFPDFGCIFGCDQPAPGGNGWDFNFPDFGNPFGNWQMPAFPNFGEWKMPDFGCLFGCNNGGGAPANPTGTIPENAISSGAVNGTTSSPVPQVISDNLWWLLVLIIIIAIYIYINRKKLLKPKKSHRSR